MKNPAWLATTTGPPPRFVLRWQDPPPPYTGRGGISEPEHSATPLPDVNHAEELRTNPCRWGCIFECAGDRNQAAGQANQINRGRRGFGSGFQAVSRRLGDGRYGTYARYVGVLADQYPISPWRQVAPTKPSVPRRRGRGAPTNPDGPPAAKLLPAGTRVTLGRIIAERLDQQTQTPWWVTDGTDGRHWPNTLVTQLINQGATVTRPDPAT